jgi:anaphase-promoting complex subunit 3
MAPNSAAIGGLLRHVIHYHLDNSSYSNALFFAERYVAQDPKSTEAAYLVALSHLRLRDFRSAYDLSKPYGYRAIHLGCVWVFAQACLALERYKDGITAMEKSRPSWTYKNSSTKHSSSSRSAAPDGASMLCLLARLCRGHDDKKKAISCFEEALKLNPFMWDAFTALCDMGVPVRVPNIFKNSEHLLYLFGDSLASTTEAREPVNGTAHDGGVFKKTTGRMLGMDWGTDPFSATTGAGDNIGSDAEMLGDAGQHSDFLSKIQATRKRLVATSNGSNSGSDGMETPPAISLHETGISRSLHPHDPPQAPPRRTRTANTVDTATDAPPPRMNYRLGGRKMTTREREKDDLLRQGPVDIVYQEVEAPTTSTEKRTLVPPVERKRTVSGHPVPRSTNAAGDDQGTRRSQRLIRPSTKTNSTAVTAGMTAGRELKKARPPISRLVRPESGGSNVGRVVSGNRKPVEDRGDTEPVETSRTKELPQPPAPPKSAEADAARAEEALRWLLDLLKKLGNGYYYLSQYQCDEALQSLSSLPAAHQGTPWALALMGKAHFEQAAYQEAEKFFRKMRVQAPSRLEDMEVYSTILWHLKKETDLSFLAHELIDSAWHSPQAWCALGNAWSLARDPEQALRCFKRATQLDPKFAYAFTLQGHEHVANEEYDKALTAYRQAIAADRRHYNAYYGIGRVQERLGAYDKAYTHFHAASTINPNNAVLICCIGTVLEKQKQIMPALQAYTKAAELAPRAAQTRYKKARGLLAVGQVDDAHKELMILKDLAPDEGTVHFLLGTLYKTVNDKAAATRHFTIALALDPKVCLSHLSESLYSDAHNSQAGPKIKEAIESLEDDVPMDDSMME